MKIVYPVIAGLLIAGAALIGQVSANTQTGVLTRPNNGAPAVGTLCRVVTNASGRVNFDANLNSFGANVNIQPPIPFCGLQQTNHATQLMTTCFNGVQFWQLKQGTPAVDADILHDCSANGGGQRADWGAAN